MRGEALAAYSRTGGSETPGYPLSRGRADHPLQVAGAALLADPDGALYWPEEKLLVVADLHLEKGSSYARHGQMLPPYDTRDTLGRLEAEVAALAPRALVLLGDSFHDEGSEARRHAAMPRGEEPPQALRF